MEKTLNLKTTSDDILSEGFIDASELANTPEVVTLNKSKKKRFFVSIVLVLFLALIVAGIAAMYFVVLPAQRVTASINSIQSQVLNLAKDLENKDISNLSSYVSNIQLEINKVDEEIDKYDFLATLDATKGYYNNFKVAKKILFKSSDLLNRTLPDLTEILEASGFTAEKNVIVEVVNPDEEKSALNLVLKKMPEYLALYSDIETEIIDIFDDVKDIDLNYVPNVGEYNLQDNIIAINEAAYEFPSVSKKVQDFLHQLPKLIGSNKDAKYLLILQNETEMRASGGLLSMYGNMTLSSGELAEDIVLTDMWDLENYTTETLGVLSTRYGYNNIYGQLALMERGCGSYHLRAQDSGIYPDLNLTMKMLSDYYKTANKYNPTKYKDYDYIMILDVSMAKDLVKLVEPLQIEGYGEVTSDQLYGFIKSESDAEGAGSERKDIVKDIANVAKEKFFNMPLEQLPVLLSTIIHSFQAKDIALSAPTDLELQAYFDTYGMSGRIVNDFDGDYFHLNEAQNCSLKLNQFIRDSVEQNVYINEDGSINRDLKITWIQPQVYEPGLAKQYSPDYNFSYRAWMRVFTPEGTTGFISDGYKQSGYMGYTPITYFDKKMDKQINDNIVQFDHRRFKEEDPLFRKDMNISYKLPSSINYINDEGYKLLLQKHPGKSWGEQYKINVNQSGEIYTIEFILDRDKILTYQDGAISVDNYDTSLDWIPDLVNKVL